MLLLLLAVCIVLWLLYVVFVKHSYWKNKGVPGPRPLPVVGNIGPSLIGRKNVAEVYAEIYKQFEDCPFVGVYRLGQPCLLIRDPDIIKNVLIKDFHHFTDNDILVDRNLEPLLGRNPFVLKGEEWKKVRQSVTPNFASGKIKAMFPVGVHASENLIKYLEKHQGDTLDAKDMILRYNCDMVAVCAFGIEGNSFENPNDDFYNMARQFAVVGSWQALKMTISFLLPKLTKLKVLSKEFDEGVMGLTNGTLKYRSENNIKRNDYFDAASNIPSMSNVEIAVHVSYLIIDGTDTTSAVMTFILYELAVNQDCQVKLREDINNTLKKHNGQVSYEAMQEMVYLEACINENLRLHPPLAQLGKTCVEDYTITSTGSEFRNLSVTLKKDTPIIISLLGLHRDPKNYKSADKFIPERFLEKQDSQKYVYMPFGNGPRMCLGSRFALMQMKVGLIQLVRNFEITLDPKTIHPVQNDPTFFGLYPKGGVSFRCKKIDTTH